MDWIKMLREDQDLADLLCDVCDVEILPEFQTPQDEGGHLTYNLSGKTFARAGSGSEYILLEDGSIGFWGSEGECGRIADNLKEFFEFMINCPYWEDYLDEDEYKDRKELAEFAKKSTRSIWKTPRTRNLICRKRSRNWRMVWESKRKRMPRNC